MSDFLGRRPLRALCIRVAIALAVLASGLLVASVVPESGISSANAQTQQRPLGHVLSFMTSSVDTYDEKGRFLGRIARERITIPNGGLPFYRRRGPFIEVELSGRKLWIKDTQVRIATGPSPRRRYYYKRSAPSGSERPPAAPHSTALSHSRSGSMAQRPAQPAPPPAYSNPITKAPPPPAMRRFEYKAERPPAASAPPAAIAAPPPTVRSAPPIGAGSPPASGNETATSSETARSRSVTPRVDGAAPSPGAIGADPNKDWDVMPVFYGTDRDRKDGAKRIEYTSARAKRLELGRALVTIPKSHQVPNIERPWALKILGYTIYQETEDPKRHFTIAELRHMDRAAFLDIVRERLRASSEFKDHALVFIHGYNNSFDDALYRIAQIAYDLKFDGAPFMYSWPSGAGLLTYGNDQDSAKLAESYLKEFLSLVTKESGAKKVSIIAHSMGNRPLLEVLRELKRTAPEGIQISQVIFAAPDVDRDIFEAIGREIRGVGEGMTLLVSANDVAMSLSRRLAGGTVPRAGDVPPQGPLIVTGIDTIDVSGISTDILAANHNTYAESKELLEDLRKLIKTGVRPPHVRQNSYERMPTPIGDYWRWRPAQQ